METVVVQSLGEKMELVVTIAGNAFVDDEPLETT